MRGQQWQSRADEPRIAGANYCRATPRVAGRALRPRGLDRDAKSPREEFKRVRDSLHARGSIGVRGEVVWKA